MAFSTILGQTPLGTTLPSNLKATIPTIMALPKNIPQGYNVVVAGMLPNSNPGVYGMVFGYQTPAGAMVDTKTSGSWKTPGSEKYNMMKVMTTTDPGTRSAQTEYWEVWFSDDDVNSDTWSTEVAMTVNGTQYPFTLTKKRTGDGFADEATDEVTEAKLEPNGYDRPVK